MYCLIFGVGKDELFVSPQPTFLALSGGFFPCLLTTLAASLIKIIEGNNKNLYFITFNKISSQILLMISTYWSNLYNRNKINESLNKIQLQGAEEKVQRGGRQQIKSWVDWGKNLALRGGASESAGCKGMRKGSKRLCNLLQQQSIFLPAYWTSEYRHNRKDQEWRVSSNQKAILDYPSKGEANLIKN